MAPFDFDPTATIRLLRRVGVFVLVFGVTYLLGRLVVTPTATYLADRRGLNETLEQALDHTLRWGVLVGAVAGAAVATGFGSLLGGSAIIVAAMTLAVGFAAQDVIGNLVSGVFLVQDPRFNVGDVVEWGDGVGQIREITFRTTRLRALDGTLVSVPNKSFTNGPVTNHSAGERQRLTVTFNVGLDTDIDAAREALVSEAEHMEQVLDDPPPVARVLEVGDPHVTLEVQLWHARRGQVQPDVRSAYVSRVKKRFDRMDVDFSPDTGQRLTGELGLRTADGADT